MISHLNDDFRARFRKLPVTIQEQARTAYRLWVQNPNHPSLDFTKVHPKRPVYSVRVARNWRAVGLKHDNVIIWFWIGSHADYDKLLDML